MKLIRREKEADSSSLVISDWANKKTIQRINLKWFDYKTKEITGQVKSEKEVKWRRFTRS